MGDMVIPSDTVEEFATLLNRPDRDLSVDDIRGALRYRAEHGQDGQDGNKTSRLANLEALFQPVHDELGERIAKTAEGRRLIEARKELEDEMRGIDDRARSEEVDRKVASHDKVVLLDRFHREHEGEILAFAAGSAELQPPFGKILGAAGFNAPKVWQTRVSPHGGMLIESLPAPDDSSGQAVGAPAPYVPPAINTCMWPQYPREFAHEDAQGVSSDSDIYATGWTGGVGMKPAAWPIGEVSGHALVGGNVFSVPAGPYLYQVAIQYKYEFKAGCWSFMSIAGAGVDFWAELDIDGRKEVRGEELFYVNSLIVGGNGAAGNAIRMVKFQFTRDGSQPGEIHIMAGISAHAEAGGSPFSGYAGVNVDAEVRVMCLESLA